MGKKLTVERDFTGCIYFFNVTAKMTPLSVITDITPTREISVITHPGALHFA